MLSTVQEIEEKALRLSHSERAMLAEHLIQSLEDPEDDSDIEQIWIVEAERRYKEYKDGKVKAKPAELAFKDAYSKIG